MEDEIKLKTETILSIAKIKGVAEQLEASFNPKILAGLVDEILAELSKLRESLVEQI